MSSKGKQSIKGQYHFDFDPETGKMKKVPETKKCGYCRKEFTVPPGYKGDQWVCEECHRTEKDATEKYEVRHILRRIGGHPDSDDE